MLHNRTRTGQTKAKEPKAAPMVGMIGHAISQHPSIVGGGTAFIIIFGFIAANALYYQKGLHPAPILDMRGPQNINSSSTRPLAMPVLKEGPVNRVGDVKTFVIEHHDGIKTSTIAHSDLTNTHNVPTPTAVRTQLTPSSEDEAEILIKDIQALLSTKELYEGDIDGLMGPMTQKAIKAYQQKHQLTVDGLPDSALRDHLNGEAQRQELARLDVPTAPEPSDLTRKIQIGLKQSAYPYIVVDGLVGAQTKEAILLFERHYRLPQTGEPNERVLEKLKKIGAFN